MPTAKKRHKKSIQSWQWHLLDAIAVIGILVLASRPDGLAIALAAVLVTVAALLFRWFSRVTAQASTAHQTQPPRVTVADSKPVQPLRATSSRRAPPEKRKSWLAGDD